MRFKTYYYKEFWKKGWVKRPNIISEAKKVDVSVGREIAKKLKVKFNGWWPEANRWTFTDPKTGSTFLGKDYDEAKKELSLTREGYEKNEGRNK